MSMIDNDWLPAIKEEYSKPYYKELFTFVKDEYSKYVVYPPADDIFNAFHFTPLSKVKVLILGQDPYHNVHQAHGLSFSVLPGEEAPPSLKNIYKELHDDCGCYIPNNGAKYVSYRVRKGDSLSRIANKYGVSISHLCKLNGIKRNGVLREGKILRIK